MDMLQDPDMTEVVEDFIAEASKIYEEIEEILEDYEDEPSASKLETFGQTIDRVMGAAKTIEAHKTGLYCELGKTISYKASQVNDQQLLDIVVAVLFDTVEILKSMIQSISKFKKEEVEGINLETFATRLNWLASKFNDIQRSSVAVNADTEDTDQKNIDAILKDLGL